MTSDGYVTGNGNVYSDEQILELVAQLEAVHKAREHRIDNLMRLQEAVAMFLRVRTRADCERFKNGCRMIGEIGILQVLDAFRETLD